ncbi:MAG: hypothetical protein IT385_03955 [Deltaproteobacteria bacterium]|nr:hypothetical protein [Deltaproteobacteria bacterium]
MSRSRALVAFVVLGGALAALGRALPSGPPELVVRVPAGATTMEIERAVDEAVLVELGLELGWRTDRVIVDGLARGLGFIGVEGDRAALLERAAALDLPRRDPLARARAMERARAALTRTPSPTDAELALFLAAHADRFRRPAVVSFAHELVGDGPPELTLGPRVTRSEDRLARQLGPEATRALMTLPIQPEGGATVWSEPIRSRLGLHRVIVYARTPAGVPPLAAIRDEVLGAWREARKAEQLALGLERLRARHTISVSEVAP